ncbi:Cellulose synthase [Cinnamomum micranthum f. kanehirae]|uniref:Cellulose synthase n=1 Tax=Cinnamomum micranthum f. kanehirae TaxID=337451 RepID=A0A443P2Z4_9MAGN|nr:Cellulose synthase [Cinnamomum micranthum f. kanehirae]
MSLPLQEKISGKKSLRRASDFLLLFLLLSLIFYRLLHLKEQGPVWALALICETWFIFTSLLGLNIQWSAVDRKTYPDRLLKRVKNLPPVDIFVTTADSTLEPPIITVNTVLSLLAVDYPAHKLACYVSDDGGSPITFYSLVEASKFAKIWVPFCKKYGVQERAPSMYFTKKPEEVPHGHSSDVFMQEWENMESHYNELSKKIAAAVQKSVPSNLTDEFGADFYDFEHGNHPSMVKVILENKKSDRDEPPHLVYVAREKRPGQPHHFKAGAMNVLTRVSGLMTNAPFLLNVDCDMSVNNPQVVLHAMCLLLGTEERESGFVQFPQVFYGSLKDDPFGSSLVVSQEVSNPLCSFRAAFFKMLSMFIYHITSMKNVR